MAGFNVTRMDVRPEALVGSPEGLGRVLDRASTEPVCAIDTEADSLHRYRESLCLIQFAWNKDACLIDPLAINDLQPLADYLAERTVWMHGADYDMTMLKREFGSLPRHVFDTQIGVRLLGLRKFGLANLVEHYFQVSLSKSSQKADWGKRPLSEKMTEYALNDVRYLLPMAEKIVAELKEAGRYDWFLESCETARLKVMERDEEREDPWRIQGAGRLDRSGLHFLKELWLWRDQEAEKWDRPTFMVATNKQILEWATDLAGGRRAELPPHYRPDRRRRFDAMLKVAKSAPAESYPKRIRTPRRRKDKDFDRQVDDLISRRNKVAEELGIEGSVIASRGLIEALVAGDDGAGDAFMSWQRSCLGLG